MAVITIGIDPEIHLGPLTLAWHGVTIALGVLIGGLAAGRWARERGLDREPLYSLGVVVGIGGIVGGRLFYVLEHGGPLFGTRGFTFDGGVILAAVLLALYVWRTRLSGLYLDAIAAGLPLGVAIGRIGDVINGEHYGARSDFFLAVRNSHPDALTPNPAFAYQNGGLYEVLLGALIFAVVWPLRHRLPHVGDMAWLVLGLFSIGRFFELFVRVDSPELALGLNNAQWTSIGMLIVVLLGWTITARRGSLARRDPSRPDPQGA
jgi:phosphatidylglycerol---prolipoprotein diacylglyceryl transferase